MIKIVLLASVLAVAKTKPIVYGRVKDTSTANNTSNGGKLVKDAFVINIISNWNANITEYLKDKHNLNVDEVNEIEEIMDDFLVELTNDLKEFVSKDSDLTKLSYKRQLGKSTDIEDGLDDSEIQALFSILKRAYPKIRDANAWVVIHRIRQNLSVMRQKINYVIARSYNS